MSKQGVVARDSQADLSQALASGQLSDVLAQRGQDILTRMQTPLRLSVLGLPGSGKSTLLNLLLGENVFSQDHRLPTMSITYGEKASAACTLPSGRIETLDSADLDSIAILKPAFVELFLPLPALRKLSMMEVVSGKDPSDQQRAIRWAAKRTDLALWCTDQCDPKEEPLWGLLPGNVLDHSFLVVTKVDVLGKEGRLAGVMKEAESVGRDYFRQVLPIATTVALSARGTNGQVDKPTMRASGGIALISAILREVETGQRAASDAADMFLSQINFVPPQTKVAKAAKATPKAPEQAADAAVPVAEHVTTEPPASASKKAPAFKEAAPEVREPTAGVAESQSQTAQTGPAQLTDAARALCVQLVDQLTAEGQALAQHLEAGDLEPASVVDVSVDTVTWLSDYLSDNEAAHEPAMARTCATASDAADLVQLIQLEKGDNVALDALSLMIQLKHEIQAELAA